MQRSSLFEILRTFTPNELSKFEEMAESSYFNKNKNVIILLNEIKKYYPSFENEDLEKEKIWKKMFPGKEYNYGIIKNLIFDLSKLAEKFIMLQRFNKDEYKQNEFLLRALLDRQLHKMYLSKHKSILKGPDIKYLNENSLTMMDYINYMRDIHMMKRQYHVEFDLNFKNDKLNDDINSFTISSLLVTLFSNYVIAVADWHSRNFDLTNDPNSRIIELILPGLEDLIKSVSKNSLMTIAHAEILFLYYVSLKEGTEKSYRDFKKIVFENSNSLSKYDLQTFHIYLLTMFIRDDFKFLNVHNEVLEIYDSMIENNVMTTLRTGVIPVNTFNNYIYKSFLISDIARIEKFSSRFLDKLDPQWIESCSVYVSFLISFLRKDFRKALSDLSLHEIPYFVQKINLKYLKAKCLYEIEDYEMFLNEYDSLKHFIRNNSFVNDQQAGRMNKFYSTLKKLFQLKFSFDKYEFEKLREDVLLTYNNSQPWFNEKLNEMENAYIN